MVEGQLLKNVKEFPYLGRVVDTHGGTDKDAQGLERLEQCLSC